MKSKIRLNSVTRGKNDCQSTVTAEKVNTDKAMITTEYLLIKNGIVIKNALLNPPNTTNIPNTLNLKLMNPAKNRNKISN